MTVIIDTDVRLIKDITSNDNKFLLQLPTNAMTIKTLIMEKDVGMVCQKECRQGRDAA